MTPDPQLFDDLSTPSARSTDPRTSWAAAKSFDKATLGRQQRAILLVIHRAGDKGEICHTIAKRVGNESSRVARRITDLVELGLVEDSGTTRVAPTRRHQILWRCAGKGRMEAARLEAGAA